MPSGVAGDDVCLIAGWLWLRTGLWGTGDGPLCFFLHLEKSNVYFNVLYLVHCVGYDLPNIPPVSALCPLSAVLPLSFSGFSAEVCMTRLWGVLPPSQYEYLIKIISHDMHTTRILVYLLCRIQTNKCDFGTTNKSCLHLKKKKSQQVRITCQIFRKHRMCYGSESEHVVLTCCDIVYTNPSIHTDVSISPGHGPLLTALRISNTGREVASSNFIKTKQRWCLVPQPLVLT